MQVFHWILVAAVIFVLVNPTEAWRSRRFRKRLKKVAKKLKLCDVFFGVACPALVGAAAATITAGSGGVGAAAGAVGAAAGKQGCKVAKKKKCKRSVVSGLMLLPFSDNFADYDQNEDKLISYEEFTFAVMRSLPMDHPEELNEPFIFADLNNDDHLDTDEFNGAPFLFAHVTNNVQNINQTLTNSSILNITDDGNLDMTADLAIEQKPVV